ncbi:MAG TPA: ankyrin repeat domain-containing protein [Cytophagaceae bacterium]
MKINQVSDDYVKAIQIGDIVKIRMGLMDGLDVNGTSPNGMPLLGLLQTNKEEVARLLLESGANPDQRKDGQSILSWACQASYIDLVKVLLEFNADPEIDDGDPMCKALGAETEEDTIKIMDLLFTYGAEFNRIYTFSDGFEGTLFMRAIEEGKKEVIKFLLDQEIDFHFVNKEGKSALSLAKDKEMKDVVMALKQKGVTLGSTSNK